jgi:tetratricopeptide (TPR) repeat protein
MAIKTYKPYLPTVILATVGICGLLYLASGNNARTGFEDRADTARDHPEIPNPINKVIRDIDYAWDHISLGDKYTKEGEYEKAAQAYKEAYTMPTPSGVLGGVKLVAVYEKLGRYDEALTLIDEIDTKYYKSEYGHQQAAEIRARLLAAKQK